MLTETILAVRGLWGSEPFNLAGKFVQIQNGNVTGGPVQQPYFPFLIGGAGEKMILRHVARYADMCNLEANKAPSPDDVRRKFDVLRNYCDAFGRPYESIVRSHW
jgi:alkanesulfonate monooxygenase SsuD/methylene tetrahydromethanopterin reductase-like flavin-dependent oxidoreductase (luciferase family)